MCDVEDRPARGLQPTGRGEHVADSRTARIDPRKSRAKIGILRSPDGNHDLPEVFARGAATIPIASSRPGIESMMSVRRMISFASIQPPR